MQVQACASVGRRRLQQLGQTALESGGLRGSQRPRWLPGGTVCSANSEKTDTKTPQADSHDILQPSFLQLFE